MLVGTLGRKRCKGVVWW